MVVLNQTQEAAPSTAPRDLTIQTVEDHPTSVILRWQSPKQPNGQITGRLGFFLKLKKRNIFNIALVPVFIGYLVIYSTDNTKRDRDWQVEGVIGDKVDAVVKGLQSNTMYYFKIQARNLKGYGPFSTTISFKTPQSE